MKELFFDSAEAEGDSCQILAKAEKLMTNYAKATGANILLLDQDYIPVLELFDKVTSENNICLLCMKYKKNAPGKKPGDSRQYPCREMHISAVKEACRSGGSYTYMCEAGFIFWTVPLYTEGNFTGAIIGSGCLGIGKDEARVQMKKMWGGALGETGLRKILEPVKTCDPQRIKSLTELALICAESLSPEDESRHAVMKRRAWQQSNLAAGIEEMKNRHPSGVFKLEYDYERKLTDALKKGDTQSGKEILNKLLVELLFAHPDDYKYIQYKAVELAIIISRTDTGPGFSSTAVLAENNRLFSLIQEAENIEELTDALYLLVDDVAARIFSFQGVRHATALKKAEYYILENFTRKISLDEIAKASGFSAPYFSTIFKEEMGENISTYINRLRVEKASYMLVNSDVPLSKITRACGFEDQSWFSKIFKAFTGVSPGKFRGMGAKPPIEFSDANL